MFLHIQFAFLPFFFNCIIACLPTLYHLPQIFLSFLFSIALSHASSLAVITCKQLFLSFLISLSLAIIIFKHFFFSFLIAFLYLFVTAFVLLLHTHVINFIFSLHAILSSTTSFEHSFEILSISVVHVIFILFIFSPHTILSFLTIFEQINLSSFSLLRQSYLTSITTSSTMTLILSTASTFLSPCPFL